MKVERHSIKGNQEIVKLCTQSKLLYNKCNFLMRHAWFNYERLPDINILVQQTQNLPCFKELHNTKTAKQTIRKVITDWSNFKKALNAYKKNPQLFIKQPKPPYYKKKLAQVVFYYETIRSKPLKNNMVVPTNDCFETKSLIPDFKQMKQVVITPKTFGFVVDVQYQEEDKPKREKLNKENVCAIDLGVNNLCTITSNQHTPILINGRIVKSINQWYNKHKCKRTSRKRYWRLENYFHHVSKYIINFCIDNDIGTIVIGRNIGWKQKVKIGKKNNQSFCSIPFYMLQQKIQYKANAVGIQVVFVDEAYTSKASYLDKDPIPDYDKDNKLEFSGKRIKRGLYQSKDGIILNADVNGSANIGRKVIQNEKIILGLDRGLAESPVVINPLRKLAA